MRKLVKWGGIIGGSLLIALVLTVILIPVFIDVRQYKPLIEKQAARAIGRPVRLGGDIRLSLFPRAGISFSDLLIENSDGFSEKHFITVAGVEARVRLLPLLSRDIQVRRFVLKSPRIVLERGKDGRVNWEGPGAGTGRSAPPADIPEESPDGGPVLRDLLVRELTVTDGTILWIDTPAGTRKSVTGINLQLTDISFDHPIGLSFSAVTDQVPLTVSGTVGPLGRVPGAGKIPVDLSVRALRQVETTLKGHVRNLSDAPRFDLTVRVSPFSLPKVFTALKRPPLVTADPDAFSHIAAEAGIRGSTETVSVSDALLTLDSSEITFSLQVRAFSGPDLTFDLKADTLDADRYLPPSRTPSPGQPPPEETTGKTDYAPLRRLRAAGTATVGHLKFRGIRGQDLRLKISGENGIFQLDPSGLNLYRGNISIKGAVDVRKDTPRSDIRLTAQNIQINPLMQDMLQKDFLTGRADADIRLKMVGDRAGEIRQTLGGQGTISLTDGAFRGVDMAAMVRNTETAFRQLLGRETRYTARTEFSEFKSVFAVKNGLISVSEATLTSPVLRATGSGTGDLNTERINFRVTPAFVSPIRKKETETVAPAGIMVPVLIGGTFSKPTFQPDLASLIRQIPEKTVDEILKAPKKEIEKIFRRKSDRKDETDTGKSAEETIGDMIRRFPFGQ
ncbi:AsmA family protein [Desulfonema ishimotonii]|uniref:AsmA family protein n=1 Tax=Desulfonema ishimotonii TaxID=45657 RepID=A0A401G181_9BACT|nr:AsmA family protein [Desulfonema ishimotonii]GBC62971.1 AsmA family protein [Desulfonema ishimotonii]